MAVSVDTAFSGKTTSGAPATSKTVTGTVAANANSVIFAWGTTSNSASTLTCTWNGVSMTAVTGGLMHTNNDAGFGFGRLFVMVAPASGSHDVVLTSTNSDDLTIGILSVYGVDQVTPNNTVATGFGNGTTVTGTLTSASGNLSAYFAGHGAALVSPNQTNQWAQNIDNLSSCGNGACQTAVGIGSSISGTWTSADVWCTVSIEIRAAPAGGGSAGGPLIGPGAIGPLAFQWQQLSGVDPPIAGPAGLVLPAHNLIYINLDTAHNW